MRLLLKLQNSPKIINQTTGNVFSKYILEYYDTSDLEIPPVYPMGKYSIIVTSMYIGYIIYKHNISEVSSA